MNIHNFFDNPDDAFIDRITEEYPILDADKKERLYAMSKDKYNSDIKNDKNNGTEVSGVERYHKPFAARFAGVAAAVLAVTVVIGGGVLLLGKGEGVDPMTDIEGTEISEEENQYEVNENGQTYGSNPDATSLEELPDLVAVLGDNGNEGYIYASDFWSAVLSSPEEALAMQESYAPRVFDVYESDGVTVIDTFTEGDRTVQNESEQAEYDYTAIAQQLFDDYMVLEKIVQFGDVAYDENDSISFFAYDSSDFEWTSEHGGERKYYKVTDERFSCCQDIYEMVRAVTTDTLSPDTNYDSKDVKWFEEAHLASWLGGDVSILEAGGKIDLAYVDEFDESLRDEFEAYLAALRVNNAVFIEYNGELYVKPRVHDFIEYTNDSIVKEIGENGFTAARYLNDWGSYINYGNEIILEIVSEDGEWQINSRKTGAMVEYLSSIGIRNYLWNKPEYYDIELLDIIEHLEVTDYDEETLSCKVHGILPDINGEDAIEITAEVIISPAMTTGAVKSADIVRLNEYDGTLVRPEVLLRDDYSPLN